MLTLMGTNKVIADNPGKFLEGTLRVYDCFYIPFSSPQAREQD